MNTETQKQKRSIWSVLGLIALAVVGVIAIAFLVSALFGRPADAEEGPEVTLPTPMPSTPIATALVAINVRSGPGTLYPSYGVAPQGSTGEVIGVSSTGHWWVIKMAPEIAPTGQGWVSGEYVQVTGGENLPVVPTPPQPPDVEIPPPPPGAPTATALEAINVRSGPGTNYPAYGVAPQGAKGEVIGVSEDGGWWVIKLPTNVVGEGQAWVSADWVTTTNTEGLPVIPAP